ncbi:MAG: hypothetical protein EZS28_045343, partial [Streblomastix strix]
TLNIIAKQPHVSLPSFVLRALMKQILEVLRVIHSIGLVHRPPGSGRVYAKICDFGFTKKEDLQNEQIYIVGTVPFMSPEQFNEKALITQKVDIYALGITFYNIITHKFPVKCPSLKEQGKKMAKLKSIDRPSEIKGDILWGLLSKMLEFDPIKRITAAEALQHPYFTSPEAILDISKEQQDLASSATTAKLEIDSNITEFDKDPTFIVAQS